MEENRWSWDEILRRCGVRLVEAPKLKFQCLHCRRMWRPIVLEGHLPEGYWQCPHCEVEGLE